MRRSLLLVLLLGALALVVAGCGGGEEAAPTAEEVAGQTETDNSGTVEEQTEGEEGEEGGEGGATEGDAQAGEAIYNSAGCGGCHTMEAAGSTGNVGPNLDESKPDFELAVDRVTNGKGTMPAFKDDLSEEDINNVSAYVVESTGGS